MRTGGGRKAKAERAARRERVAEATSGGPLIRMRPSGVGGVLLVQLVAWAAVALIAWGALVLDRWNQLSYPDSLWLFAAIGVVSVAPAVGRVARTVRDADLWGAEALVVPVALFVYEVVEGPGCPTGGDCAAIGVRGSLGLVGSLVVLALAAVTAWGLARWQHRSAAERRPASGRVRYGATVMAMLGLFLFPGSVIAASFVGLDLLARDTPKLVDLAKQEVERECYGLASAPALAVRAAPNGYNPQWTTFAVRRANESRPGVNGKKLSGAWATRDEVHPYEATASFSPEGDPVGVTCRKVGPGTSNATKDDLTSTPPDSNPLSPKTTGSQFLPRFFTQGEAGPTEEGQRLLDEQAAAEADDEAADEPADEGAEQ